MKVENVCEKCGKLEPGYGAEAVNAKLRKVAKGPAGRQVVSFICSRCVQKMVNKTKEVSEYVNETGEARSNLERERLVHPSQSARNRFGT